MMKISYVCEDITFSWTCYNGPKEVRMNVMKVQGKGICMISKDARKERIGYMGFSFSAMLLSPFVQVYRKDVKGSIFYFLLFWLFGEFVSPFIVHRYGVYLGYLGYLMLWLFSGLTYNKVQMLILLNDKYLPKFADDVDRLREAGYYVEHVYAKERQTKTS